MKRFVQRAATACFVTCSLLDWSPVDAATIEKFGRISITYPDGWTVQVVDRTNRRVVTNYAIYNPKDEYAGRRGQTTIRVYDPIFVFEQLKLASPIENDAAAFLEKFVSAYAARPHSAVTRALGNAELYYTTVAGDGTADNTDVTYVSVQRPNGVVNILGAAHGSGELDSVWPIIREIAVGMNLAFPPAPDEPAEQLMKRWFDAVGTGRLGDLRALMCPEGTVMNSITDALLRSMTRDVSSGDILNLMFTYQAATGITTDYSNLFYETLQTTANGSKLVRVGGNVVFRRDGEVTKVEPFFWLNPRGWNLAFVYNSNGGLCFLDYEGP